MLPGKAAEVFNRTQVRKDTGMTDLAMGQENEQNNLWRALPILITWCSETQCGFPATVKH